VTRTRIDALLERVGLADRADYLDETYSRGMKQRLHLARGLVADARVLFLDEPTTGMDPIAARDFRQLVLDLRAQGRTILLATHDMAEAEAVCDRVALIEHGRLLAVETPASLGRLVAQFERIDFEGGPPDIEDRLLAMPEVQALTRISELTQRIELVDAEAAHAVLSLLVDAGVTSLRTSRPSLEEVYIHLIGRHRPVTA
jgi:ABC-2 type transport system ATP-binding protein